MSIATIVKTFMVRGDKRITLFLNFFIVFCRQMSIWIIILFWCFILLSTLFPLQLSFCFSNLFISVCRLCWRLSSKFIVFLGFGFIFNKLRYWENYWKPSVPMPSLRITGLITYCFIAIFLYVTVLFSWDCKLIQKEIHSSSKCWGGGIATIWELN